MKLWAVLLSLTFATAALAQSAVTPAGIQTPGCTGEIARYRTVEQNDYASGNLAKSVHSRIQREIAAADRVCAAGEQGAATTMIHASETRHGYSTHI